ncbi:unannotated protein [freshwater metagenome]|uniref:Unannotated protein n=1 Tax=freshwater metagenome TaxID=449393 RepID=A0A6J6YF87_9ZZZZ
MKFISDPVTTIVNPARVCGNFSVTASIIKTPDFSHLVTIFRCHFSLNHSLIDCAITPPTPSISESSSKVARSISAIFPNLFARAWAAVGPTWRIESATKIRHNGRALAPSKAAINFSALAPISPSFLIKNFDFFKSEIVSENIADSSSINLSSNKALAASYPKTSISKAALEPM